MPKANYTVSKTLKQKLASTNTSPDVLARMNKLEDMMSQVYPTSSTTTGGSIVNKLTLELVIATGEEMYLLLTHLNNVLMSHLCVPPGFMVINQTSQIFVIHQT